MSRAGHDAQPESGSAIRRGQRSPLAAGFRRPARSQSPGRRPGDGGTEFRSPAGHLPYRSFRVAPVRAFQITTELGVVTA